MLTDLKIKNKVVGTKQTLKAMEEEKVVKIYLAVDIDQKIQTKILKNAEKMNIPIDFVDSKLKLGRACGIDVAAASAAILE